MIDGLKVTNSAPGCTIRGLAIGNMGGHAITLLSDNNMVEGNYIGTDAAGQAPRTNNTSGIEIRDGTNNVIRGNLVAASLTGININDDADMEDTLITAGNLIVGNLVGTDAKGTNALPNRGGNGGIRIAHSPLNTVHSNLISGNIERGIGVAFTGSVYNILSGNFIGTTAAGSAVLSNGLDGIQVLNGASYTLVSNNVISGNGQAGVLLRTSGANPSFINNTIIANRIGCDSSGILPLPNASHGVFFDGGGEGASNSWGNLIGGTNASVGNVIAYNRGSGIVIAPGYYFGNPLTQNRIFGNSGLAIDLANDGHTPNDIGDALVGPNWTVNYPVLTSMVQVADTYVVSGYLHREAFSGNRLEFFSDSGVDTNGLSQGRVYLGSTNLTVGLSGTNAGWFFGVSNFTVILSATGGPFISATTVTLSEGTPFATSEFSDPIAVSRVLSWTNAGGGPWEVATNWSPRLPPSYYFDRIDITNAGSKTVLMGMSVTTQPGSAIFREVHLGAPAGQTNRLRIADLPTNSVPKGWITSEPGGEVVLSNCTANLEFFQFVGNLVVETNTVLNASLPLGHISDGITNYDAITTATIRGGKVFAHTVGLGWVSSTTILTMASGNLTVTGELWLGFTAGSKLILSGGEVNITTGVYVQGSSFERAEAALIISNGTFDSQGPYWISLGSGAIRQSGGKFAAVELKLGSADLIYGEDPCTFTSTVAVAGGTFAITNGARNATLEVLAGGIVTQSGGTLIIDRLVITNPCARFIRTGGTFICTNIVLNSAFDADGDGLPNGWEQAHGFDVFSPAGTNGPDADADGDGTSNRAEWLAGTNPTNPASVFAIRSITPTGTAIQVNWTMGPGRTNLLEMSTNVVTHPFVTLLTISNTTGSSTGYTHNGGLTNGSPLFYRIRIGP